MSLKRSDFRFFQRMRVRWSEVDMQKIVFNAHYLMYFDTAVSGYWRALAFPYENTMEHFDGDLFVVKATVEFHASARLDDHIDVAMKCQRIGNSSITFTGAIFRGDEHLISGELVYVFADPVTQKSRPVPTDFRLALEAYEAGEAMTSVRVGSWAEMGPDAQRLRSAVFVQEQRIPKELEWDEADHTAVHAVAYNRLGRPVATGRLLTHGPGVARIGRMAVERALRGSHIGRDLLQALMAVARQRGDTEVMLHAQQSAEGFYARMGYQRRGEPFEEAGIPHQEMTVRL